MTTSDAELRGAGEPTAPQQPSKPTSVAPGLAPVDVGPDGHLVWRSLRDAWLTHRVVAGQETHVKGGFAWNASKYAPVFVHDEDGDPFLSFAKD